MRALQAELERMLRQCAGGAVSDCRVIEVLSEHRLCMPIIRASKERLRDPPTGCGAARRSALQNS
jgi:hypothetical protein